MAHPDMKLEVSTHTRRGVFVRSLVVAGCCVAMVSAGIPNPCLGAVVEIVDCNMNGIPDEVDIDSCGGAPACDDCNLNAVPDSCDIAAGTSVDGDMDGVPDECVFFDGGGKDNNWGTAENWDNDEVPNIDQPGSDTSVTVDVETVNLDLAVTIGTLRLRDGTSMTVLGQFDENFDVLEPGGVLIASSTSVQTELIVGNGRIMTVLPGTLRIESGGVFGNAVASPCAASSTQAAGPAARDAALEVGGIRVASRCGEPIPGKMTLAGTAEVRVTNLGDVIVDGSQDCVACAVCSPNATSDTAAMAGGETPPVIRLTDCAALHIEGNLVLLGGVQFIHTSSTPIELGGSFINLSTCPECFEISGTIVFSAPNFSLLPGVNPTQFVEAAGRDLGLNAKGFTSNFAIGTLEVGSSAVVEFADQFSNTGGQGAEALYVDTLILRQNAIVHVMDSNIYCNTLIDEGAIIEYLGAGTLMSANDPIPAASTWGLICLTLLLLVAGTLAFRRPARIVCR